ncbi:MAG: Thiamine biosynthesis lipoprotein ApbE precursor [Verrucomicrobiota bacterium]|jgi:thiamine biosynthesis lipoprotein
MLRFLAVALVWLELAAVSLAAPPELISLRGATMGSTWAVTYRPGAGTPTRSAVERAMQERLDELERQMSTWRADSDLSHFNAARDTNWFPVPRDTAVVVREALAVSALTDGAFDPTVFPLVQLWGFGPAGRRVGLPTTNEIASALAKVGWRKLDARLTPPALRKSQPDVAVDLSALCPGYASDCLGELLVTLGVRDFLVDVGGELKAAGNGASGPGWRVGVEQPPSRAPGERSLAATLPLVNQSLATSGDYRNAFSLAGRRFSHHLDPRTGWPVESLVVSVSVVHSSTMRADAMGTALTVLGFERAWALAEREKVGVLFILRHGERFTLCATDGWPREGKKD